MGHDGGTPSHGWGGGTLAMGVSMRGDTWAPGLCGALCHPGGRFWEPPRPTCSFSWWSLTSRRRCSSSAVASSRLRWSPESVPARATRSSCCSARAWGDIGDSTALGNRWVAQGQEDIGDNTGLGNRGWHRDRGTSGVAQGLGDIRGGAGPSGPPPAASRSGAAVVLLPAQPPAPRAPAPTGPARPPAPPADPEITSEPQKSPVNPKNHKQTRTISTTLQASCPNNQQECQESKLHPKNHQQCPQQSPCASKISSASQNPTFHPKNLRYSLITNIVPQQSSLKPPKITIPPQQSPPQRPKIAPPCPQNHSRSPKSPCPPGPCAPSRAGGARAGPGGHRGRSAGPLSPRPPRLPPPPGAAPAAPAPAPAGPRPAPLRDTGTDMGTPPDMGTSHRGDTSVMGTPQSPPWDTPKPMGTCQSLGITLVSGNCPCQWGKVDGAEDEDGDS